MGRSASRLKRTRSGVVRVPRSIFGMAFLSTTAPILTTDISRRTAEGCEPGLPRLKRDWESSEFPAYFLAWLSFRRRLQYHHWHFSAGNAGLRAWATAA